MKKILLSLFLLTISPIFSMNETSGQSEESRKEDSVLIYPKEILDAHINWVNATGITTDTKLVWCPRGGLNVRYMKVPEKFKEEYDKFFETLTLDKNKIHKIPAKSISPSMRNIFDTYAGCAYRNSH